MAWRTVKRIFSGAFLRTESQEKNCGRLGKQMVCNRGDSFALYSSRFSRTCTRSLSGTTFLYSAMIASSIIRRVSALIG
jgi:hypothetical protein